jgi:hypothetical protein
MINPYKNLPLKAFWKEAVASKNMFDIEGLWEPKFDIRPEDKVVTFGSCFAQHIGRALANRGFSWFISELPPENMPLEQITHHNYNIFSARTGNIYTSSLLYQWVQWSLNEASIPDEIWSKDNRFYDPFRPNIHPNGFENVDELKASLKITVNNFYQCIKKAKYFVFTLGLTESWLNSKYGYEYPTCPGTVAGDFNEKIHIFKNQSYEEIKDKTISSIELMLKINPTLRFILTVSPVPLTATKSGKHVLVATMSSKSILRAVADSVSQSFNYVDYFPSYEIINSPSFGGVFFEPNKRNVNHIGVNFVMEQFFNGLTDTHHTKIDKINAGLYAKKDPTCEEQLLEAFAPKNLNLPKKQEIFDGDIVVVGNSHIHSFKMSLSELAPTLSKVFVPADWIKNTLYQSLNENGLTEFIFDDQHSKNISDIKIVNPKFLIMVGIFLAGDNIVRAHGDLRHYESPPIPRVDQINTELIEFYRIYIRNTLINLANIIEEKTKFKKIIWVSASDMTQKNAELRWGIELIQNGSYKIHREAYLIALNIESKNLKRTKFVFHPSENNNLISGFALDKFKSNEIEKDIHCNKEYFDNSTKQVLSEIEFMRKIDF